MIRLSFLMLFLYFSVASNAQITSLKGKVVDHTGKGVKGVEIYLDMKKIQVSTNGRGKYSFQHPGAFQLITIYQPEYGFVNWKYSGEKKIDFVFPKNSQPLERKAFTNLGYVTPSFTKEYERNYYANYGTILEILNHVFPDVRVKGQQITVGLRGINAVYAEDPLIMVNDVPTGVSTLQTIPTQEVKSIRVISKVSETAPYGHRGMNGVILVQLKDGRDRS